MSETTLAPQEEFTPADDAVVTEVALERQVGTEYWTTTASAILNEAWRQSQVMRNSGEPLPKWASLVEQNVSDLATKADYHGIKLAETTGRLLESPTAENVRGVSRWYRSLGPTNEAPDLGPTMLKVAEGLLKSNPTAERNVLLGNLLQDAALRSQNPQERAELYRQASSMYGQVAREGLLSHEGRGALRSKIDCEHELLQLNHELGNISTEDFYKHYEALQNHSINALLKAMSTDGEGSIGDGELLEWASLIYLRHRFWSQESAESYKVRAALPREDQAIYPWIVEDGRNPEWSFDTVVSSGELDEDIRIQLKSGAAKHSGSRERVYLPNVVKTIRSELTSHTLRGFVFRGATAISKTYQYMHNPEQMLDDTIDEASVDVMNHLYDDALSSN